MVTQLCRRKFFTQINFIADLIRLKLNFIFWKQKMLFEAPFAILIGNICTQSIAHWKARGQLPIRCKWSVFRYLLRLRRYKRKSVEVGVFRRGVTLSANFRRKEASSTNHCWCQKTRLIALCCGIKISTVHCLVLSQSTRVARQTDGRTGRETELHLIPR